MAARALPEIVSDMDFAALLLGGPQTFRRAVKTPLDAHELIAEGFPGKALTNLVENVAIVQNEEGLRKAVGVSLRTLQRQRSGQRLKLLSKEQSGRTWQFATILGKATGVFGSQREAEEWLTRPQTGLDQQRPIDLLDTSAGVGIVEDHLDRLEFGVYA